MDSSCQQKAVVMRRGSSLTSFVAILSFALLGTSASLRAQAPAGPLPAAQPKTPPPSASEQEQQPKVEKRTSIFGQWKLNLDDSDDPRKKMEEVQSSSVRGGPGGIRVGIPGLGGVGGIGGGRGGMSDADRQRVQEVILPANTLALTQKDPKDPEIDLIDDQNRKCALFTDGRKLQKPDPKNDSSQEIAAHWDGSRLVTDEKSPRGGKMSRTFELSYDGTQLYETVYLATGRSSAPVEVRYVYDPLSAPASEHNR
jgi:hypothetical protein